MHGGACSEQEEYSPGVSVSVRYSKGVYGIPDPVRCMSDPREACLALWR